MNKSLLFSVLFLLTTVSSWAGISITKSGGWLEAAFVEWTSDVAADSYNVYYSGNGLTDVKIDEQLIREYGTYYRADVMGIAAGNYTIKVVPVVGTTEGTAASTSAITVKAHDRSGFAFSDGVVPGGYKADGTPKAGAKILYITQNTKNTVSAEVTGATTNPCVGLQNISDALAKGKDGSVWIFRLVGQVTDFADMDGGDIMFSNNNNKSATGYITFEGVGEDATADGWGIRIKRGSNIEIRNIAVINCDSSEGDDISLQQDGYYVWVHNCDLFYGGAGGDSDQAKGDGALDAKRSSYVTFSYNHFWDSGKCNLLGNGTEDPGYLSYHHNWYDHSDSRHPRVRWHTVHVYNNYFDGNAKYGIGCTTASSIFAENNYFRNCKYPMLISEQGTDVAGENDGTFSGDPGGIIKAYGNYIEGAKTFVPYSENNTEFDAYIVANKSDQVPSSVTCVSGATAYNNFDTNTSIMYSYTPETPEAAKATVMAYAGRMNGGDIKFTFDNSVEDSNYAVIPALKSLITNYTTSLSAIQGDGDASSSTDTGSTDTGSTDTGSTDTGSTDTGSTGTGVSEGDMVHNFTESSKSSSFYSITGNLSTSKGSVSHNGLTLTQCLKIESSTSITFTTTVADATLIIVCNKSEGVPFAEGIAINGTEYSDAVNGVFTINLATAGTYSITKIDSGNIFYMSVGYPQTTSVEAEKAVKVSMFPNPVADQLTISSSNEVENVSVYSLAGALVTTEGANTQSVDMSNLNAGSYIVVVNTQNGVFKQMIIKK